jgi:hypothetical protein
VSVIDAWRTHLADCSACAHAELDRQAMPCPTGLRMMPLAEVDRRSEPVTRDSVSRYLVDLRDGLVRRAVA